MLEELVEFYLQMTEKVLKPWEELQLGGLQFLMEALIMAGGADDN